MKFSWFTRAAVMAVLASLVAVLSPVCLAQSDTPEAAPLLNVAIVQVNYDMRGEFEALQKEYIAAWKKRGFPARNVWRVVRGHTNEYHIVSPLEKYADLDESRPVMDEPDWTRWIARVTKCIESRRVLTFEYRSDLSIPIKAGRPFRLAQLSLHEIDGGRNPDYIELREKEILPAYKKAGFDGLYVYRARYGDSRRLWAVVRLADSWADFDKPGPLQRALGEEGFQALVGKFGQMVERSEWLVLQHLPELSHNPGQ
ncbi:hypothetical protein MYX78_08580 [Acidobacteria bacterium AH-259-G07]|nr:hypothetical protein [Acidobacteria bacterium AH-259-G07]